jgi:hypothetical protein
MPLWAGVYQIAPAGAIDAALLRQSPQRPAIKAVTISVAAKPVGAPTSG